MSLTYQRVLSLVVFTAAVACSASVFAHSDVLLADVGGKVAIGTAEDIGDPVNESLELFPPGTNGAFESIMIAGSGLVDPPDYESDEPGFYSDPAALGANALPGSAGVTASTTNFTVGAASAELFYWNGGGAVEFDPAPVNTAFEFEPASNFATTTSSGFVDGHPEFLLNAVADAVPADGVYLISPVVDVDTLATSDSFFVVLLVDALITTPELAEEVEEAVEALEEGAPNAEVDFGNGVVKDFAFYEEAVEWVEDNLVVPEPTTGMIALVVLGFAAVSRNRTA